MNKLMSLLKRRWLISLFGVLALAALIWFAGPYIAIAGREPLASPVVRLLVILLLVVLWGLNYLRKQLQAARASKQMIDDLADSAAIAPAEVPREDESAEEVALLKQHFDEAMDVLKKSRKKGGAGSLYDLPWYIIIGPPGAGKTTALLNSGLKFPLEERFGSAELKGVGGTRNCDWLFTNQAVLLDTAGRYVTQDSHAAVDSAAWEGFLNLLKKHRRRRPVNGVLVAVSLKDLMEQDAHGRDTHVRAIKQRIQELYQHFGIRLPVYVLLTKCDLVAGFTDFFDDLGREERAQVWGFTLPLDRDDESREFADRFDAEFDQLLARLNARMLSRLSQERDIKRRHLIYGFPRQMASLKETLGRFLAAVFQRNRYEEPIMLRGVYLSSGTQEGSPIDRLMGAVARTLGLDQQALPAYGRRGRSYFITRLLNDVVFPEAGLAGYNTRLESRRAWLQRGSYAGVLAITALAALGWFTSYTANNAHVKQVAGSLAEYQQIADDDRGTDTAVTDILPRLDALKAASEVTSQYDDGVPMHMRLWLYQGGVLGDAAMDAYIREMNTSFVPFIARRLEDQLRRSSGNPELQYEALKTYLMLGDPQRMEPQQVSLWMAQDWQNTFPRERDKQSRLRAHLDKVLQGTIQAAALDERLVKKVRNNLERVSLADLVYGRLKREAMADDHTAFRVTDAVGPAAQVVFVRASGADLGEGIPGLFTYEGFYKFYQEESRRSVDQIRREDWVLGDELDKAGATQLQRLDKDIRRLYIADYIRSWEGLLADLKIVPFRDVRHGTEVLEVISGPASPIVGVLEALEHNTSLNRLPDGAENMVAQAAETARNRSRIARLLDTASDVDMSSPAALPGSEVERHFQPLNSLVQSKDNRPPPVDKLITLLSELYGQLTAIEGGYHNRPAPGMTNGGGLQNTLQRLQTEGAKQREPVKSWMQQLAYNSQTVSIGSAREQLNAIWTSTLRPACEKALNNRYPFQKDGRLEVTIDDFGRFFGPNGKLDQFFQEQLKPLVDTSQSTWQWLSEGEDASWLSNEALRQIQRAAAIREAFFQDGGQNPSVHFALKPVFLDAEVKRFLLSLEGQQFKYAHGPSVIADARWPGPGGSSGVRIVFTGFDGAEASIREDGPWAWFRILDQAEKQVMSPDRFIATFAVGGRKMRYEMRASSVVNPFVMPDLQKFRCPQEF
jgi:type VI secretion system protein ImpL